MASRVFVVQVPARRSPGGWEPKYDLSPAEAFGELVPILPYGNVPRDPRPTLEAVADALADYDPAVDHLLLIGDPVAQAWVVSVARSRWPEAWLSVLKFDRRAGKYEAYRVG